MLAGFPADSPPVSTRRQRVVTADQWGKPERDHTGAPCLPLVPRPRRAAPAHVLRRRLRARMEDPQQPLVCPAGSEEARQGDLPAVRPERRQGASRVDAREAAGDRPGGAQALARRAAAVGGGSHRPGRGRRRRMRARQLPAALPSPARHARVALVTLAPLPKPRHLGLDVVSRARRKSAMRTACRKRRGPSGSSASFRSGVRSRSQAKPPARPI